MRLAKSALLCLSVLAFPTVRSAHAAWALGPLGGANISNADVDGRDARSVTSWDLGARLQMGVAPILSIMFDPMLVQSRTDFNATTGTFEGRGDFVSLDVPALLNARLTLLNLGVYGFIGPDFIFTTDANGNLQTEGDLSRNDVNPMVLAGQVGAGVAVGVAPFIDLTADARYTHGFTDLLQGAKGDIHNWRNQDVRLNLGVLLHTPHMGALFGSGSAFRNQPSDGGNG
jgi:hypothetical protein